MIKPKKWIALFSALILSIASFLPTYAYAAAAPDYNSLADFLTNAFATADSISDLEGYLQINIDITVPEANYDAAWQADARAFLEDYVNSSQVAAVYSENSSSLAAARATSVTYAIQCADWSMKQGRGHDLAKEAGYMFLSHYVDRKDYFWNQGNASKLLDGETMSGDAAFAIWITDSDRSAYESYIRSSKIAPGLEKIGTIGTGFYALNGSLASLSQVKKDYTLIRSTTNLVKLHLQGLDTALTGKGIVSDFVSLYNDVFKKMNEDPTRRVSDLFDWYMTQGNILTDYELTDYRTMVLTALSLATAGIVGGLTGVTSTLAINAVNFTMQTFTDLFSYVAWIGLQYSYSGRFALRASDALGI